MVEYQVFKDFGVYSESKIPECYKKIRVHTVYDVKHDGRHRARLVADGHLTAPVADVYAGVISLRGFRMIIFAGELNGMQPYGTDISSAYLECETDEKVCIKAGTEFGPLAGHLLIVHKALYGLRRSALLFGEHLRKKLAKIGFFPSLAEDKIFMRKCPTADVYEYIGTYVDDLAIIARDPHKIVEQLMDPKIGGFSLKGSGYLDYHLGSTFTRDENGVLCMDPSKFIDKLKAAFKRHFGHDPSKRVSSPLEAGDHPELDVSEFLNDEMTRVYQSLIGSLQWATTIGRYDICSAVMSMSKFRCMPREGHLERVKRIIGYLCKFYHFKLRFRTDEPDLSNVPVNKFDWAKTVYGQTSEEIPKDAPTPRGKRVTTVSYFDASLMHDVLSGKAVTGVLHFLNRTPFDWFCKTQATTETSTFGAEYVAGRKCIEQVIAIRQDLRYLGIPINEISYVFGDNESMIKNSTVPHSKLHKRHHILSYHFVRSMIAAGFINMNHIPSGANCSDILTKHWSYQSSYELLIKPFFHHIGNTRKLLHSKKRPLVDASFTQWVQDEDVSSIRLDYVDGQMLLSNGGESQIPPGIRIDQSVL